MVPRQVSFGVETGLRDQRDIAGIAGAFDLRSASRMGIIRADEIQDAQRTCRWSQDQGPQRRQDECSFIRHEFSP